MNESEKKLIVAFMLRANWLNNGGETKNYSNNQQIRELQEKRDNYLRKYDYEPAKEVQYKIDKLLGMEECLVARH